MKTTRDQRESLHSRASQEGVAIGGYHVIRVLDDLQDALVMLEFARGALASYAIDMPVFMEAADRLGAILDFEIIKKENEELLGKLKRAEDELEKAEYEIGELGDQICEFDYQEDY